MPENPKLFVHGTLVEICTRSEQGLPFAATPFIRLIWESILARAQTFYPITICHGTLMSNHPHLLVVVHDPDDVPHFMEYTKREVAHAVNRLLGEQKKTVWEDGYDSPVILDLNKAIERIGYCYGNAAKAHLAESIGDYPNWSTWQAFLSCKDILEVTVPRIARSSIPELPLRTMSLAEQEELAQDLEANSNESYLLRIEPNAWMKCFPELDGRDPQEINQMILDNVRRRENEAKINRSGPVLGAHALRLQSLRQPYKPNKRGRKMICLCSIINRRKGFIRWFREQVNLLRSARSACLPMEWLVSRPPGFFFPGRGLLANLNPSFVPLF